MRWLALANQMGFDIDKIDMHFVAGNKLKLSKIAGRIEAEIALIGPVSLVIIDTSAAYYEGDDENQNVQMGAHARLLRSLVTMPGEPCVVVCCHPVKNAGPENMLPRGGGAFVAEMDGNLTCAKTDSMVTLHWQGKHRGVDFAPIPFALATVTAPTLKDSKGRPIPTVIARPLTESERGEAEVKSRDDENEVLVAISESGHERVSLAELAIKLNWLTKDRKPNKSRVQRSADRLKKWKYVESARDGLYLLAKGEKEVIRLAGDGSRASATAAAEAAASPKKPRF